ncbi:hypothetical protein ACFQY0_19510 [Haloferula chungangensis]|uniref:Nucleotide-diphospho-sugar transferase domain-containing protein n=1 Tax=Haloferula chungangensis TaxID=1048331 RepID=A0ABW2LAA8_9BACT
MFLGSIHVFRNSPQPLFPVERVGLEEVEVDPGFDLSKEEFVQSASIRWRFKMTEAMANSNRHQWAVISDMDVVPLRNWDHLFENRVEDVLVNKDCEGRLDPGLIAVRGDRLSEFAAEWSAASSTVGFSENQRIDALALEQLLSSDSWKAGSFERGEVVRPFDEGANLLHCVDAAAVHLAGGTLKAKAKLAFALHMMWVYGDENGMFLDMLES